MKIFHNKMFARLLLSMIKVTFKVEIAKEKIDVMQKNKKHCNNSGIEYFVY